MYVYRAIRVSSIRSSRATELFEFIDEGRRRRLWSTARLAVHGSAYEGMMICFQQNERIDLNSSLDCHEKEKTGRGEKCFPPQIVTRWVHLDIRRTGRK